MLTSSTSTFIESLRYIITLIERGLGVADVYILCLEEFTSVEMLPPDDSSMFQILPLGTFQRDGSERALESIPLRLQEVKQ